MPDNQALVDEANARLSRAAIDSLVPATALALAIGQAETALASTATAIGLTVTPARSTFLSTWPAGVQIAVQAAVYSALSRSPRMPVTFAWAPGYDHQASIWEVADTATSRGGMTILLQSPYPRSA